MPKDKEEKAKKLMVVEEVASDEETTPVKDENKKEEPETLDVKDKKETDVIEEKKEEVSVKEIQKEKVETERPNYLWIIIPTALLVGALVGGFITYFSGVSKFNKDDETPTPISSEAPIAEPSPTSSSSETLKRDTLKIQVLNGSGVSGAAGKAKTYLEGLGYKNVDTGNAGTSDFPETEISIKDTKKEFISLLTTDLSKNYQVAKETKTLVATSSFDVVITLGKK
ncbi:MAG: LytR C-terminal domain-containing protein [Candidatus Woesebacteria bacterium]|nr:LytR C-terminal domain-containing protein [Candidatus Woesebacteria bacterium]